MLPSPGTASSCQLGASYQSVPFAPVQMYVSAFAIAAKRHAVTMTAILRNALCAFFSVFFTFSPLFTFFLPPGKIGRCLFPVFDSRIVYHISPRMQGAKYTKFLFLTHFHRIMKGRRKKFRKKNAMARPRASQLAQTAWLLPRPCERGSRSPYFPPPLPLIGSNTRSLSHQEVPHRVLILQDSR